MGIDRSRRTTFEEVANLYNETRALYPDALIEDIIRLSALPADGRILEIGCGAGNATVSFAKRGYHILGIELGEQLAEYARQNCREYPNTVIVQSEFESYDLPPRSFDLAVSADAFHWIRPEVGYPKVQTALKENGSFAFFWQISIDPQTDWSRAVDEIFQRLAPQYDRPNKPMEIERYRDIITGNLREYCGIEDVTVNIHDWVETLSADRYVKLLRTYSGFRGMDDNLRESLNAEIFAAIQNAVGSIQQPYRAILFHAKKATHE
ncbi:MAG: putative methyltransferase [Anaerolineales bacterium]|nr:putative methyltransferase [Anaerolineales bacterium]